MKPPRSLLDPAFKYTPAVSTDLAATFARVRAGMAQQKQPHPAANVQPITRKAIPK